MILIGIILIALSFTLWYYIIPPVTHLSKYDLTLVSAAAPKITFLTSNSTTPSTIYFGSITYQDQPRYNQSRPIDNSFNLSMRIDVTNGPINVTIYARDAVVFTVQTNFTKEGLVYSNQWKGSDTAVFIVQTNFTVRTLIFDSSLYNNASASRPSKSLVFPNVTTTVPTLLQDAFTGGTAPYMIIRNLNRTATTIVSSFQYSYSALFRDSSSDIPFLMFMIGAVIVIVYGIVFVRRFIKRSRGR
jgi:hypothetical protein